MKTYFENFNARTKMLISSPQFLNSNQSIPYQVSLGEGDKILTVKYGQKGASETSWLFREILCLLSHKKTLSFVFELTFREVENFLRDENHLPAFRPSDEVNFKACFENEKLAFLAAIIKEKNKEFWLDRQREFDLWQSLNLVGKNMWADLVVAKLAEDFKLHLALVWCETDQLVVSGSSQKLDNQALEKLFFELLTGENVLEKKNLPIKVVAV